MTSITIRNLDDDVKTRLRVRAVEHHRSMEEEARIILRDAVNNARAAPPDLARFTHKCYAPLGGVELEPPTRVPMREPAGAHVIDTHTTGYSQSSMQH